MPFEKFDKSKLKILSIDERVSDIDISVVMDPETYRLSFDNPKLDAIADAVIRARENNAAVILIMARMLSARAVLCYEQS